jgi:hypothetical protein
MCVIDWKKGRVLLLLLLARSCLYSISILGLSEMDVMRIGVEGTCLVTYLDIDW